MMPLAADRFQMIENLLNKQLAEILPLLHHELRIDLLNHRQNEIEEQLLGGRAEIDAADARQIRLQQFERVLPHWAGKFDHPVKSADDRVIVSLARSPGIAKPAVLIDGERN